MPQKILPNSLLRVEVTDAPLAPDSAHLVEHLVEQVVTGPYGPIPALNTTQYGLGIYTVHDQPYVSVGFRDEQKKGYLPDIFQAGGVCASAPIPADAKPAKGTDGALSVFEPSTGRLWNFWRARQDASGAWSAVWGGMISDVSTSDGRFPAYTGTSASGLVMEELVVGIAEAQAHQITHALGLGIPNVLAGAQSWPARRNDGNSAAANALHEGRRFRLPADLDLDACRTTPNWRGKTSPLASVCRDIAEAVKTYGFVISDRSRGVSIGCEMSAATKTFTGTDPWPTILQGKSTWSVLDGFPWDKLEAISYDWGKP